MVNTNRAVKKIAFLLMACFVIYCSVVPCFAAEETTYSITVYKYGSPERTDSVEVENPVKDAKNTVNDSNFFGDANNGDGDVAEGAVSPHNYASTDDALTGAHFTLSTTEDGSNPIKLYKSATNTYTACFVDDCTAHNEHIFEATSEDETAKFTIDGLPSGTYYLTETVAPDNYLKLENPVKVIIDANGNVTAQGGNATVSDGMIKVLNVYNPELPGTGGIGTTIFIIGGALLLGAGVFLIIRKRIA
ncbi:MAG: SpaA isopeptide-forming pilin-related protein [Ruminococcus sp.]